jgi:hypothetical protein
MSLQPIRIAAVFGARADEVSSYGQAAEKESES